LSGEVQFFRKKKVPSLEVIEQFLDVFKRPDESFRYRVIVAGTAGKGTVCRKVEDVLVREGKTVGTLLSPHLQIVTERVRINGQLIAPEIFGAAILRVKEKSEALNRMPTYYEAIVLAGVLAASDAGCEYLIAEVGMGGEWDAVNAFRGDRIATVTFIGADHQEILGPTLPDIAKTKAGIFTSDTVKALSYEKKYCSILQERCPVNIQFIKGLGGKLNKKIVREICEFILQTNQFEQQKIPLPAHWERVGDRIILDGAHSTPRFEYMTRTLQHQSKPLVGVCGMMKNHDWKAFRKILAYLKDVYWVDDFSANRDVWESTFLQENLKQGHVASGYQQALEVAQKDYPNANILVTGSFYLCGKIRESFYPSSEILKQKTEFPASEKGSTRNSLCE